jgi:hypothetical protein
MMIGGVRYMEDERYLGTRMHTLEIARRRNPDVSMIADLG